MGYDIHITRADDWSEGESKPIRLGEWLAYVASDGEMEIESAAEARIDGEVAVTYRNEGLAVWIGYSGHGRDGNKAWFDHRHGCIIVKNPDDEVLEKMRAIARRLKARVVGDDGEAY